MEVLVYGDFTGKKPEKDLLKLFATSLDNYDVFTTSVKEGCEKNKEWLAQKMGVWAL